METINFEVDLMKILRYISLSFVFYMNFACSEEKFSYPPDDCFSFDATEKIYSLTTREAMLKSYLIPIVLDDPIGDATKRIAFGDYRLLFFGSFGYGEIAPVSRFNLCRLSTRFIDGGGHSIESVGWALMADKFQNYVDQYNKAILLKATEITNDQSKKIEEK